MTIEPMAWSSAVREVKDQVKVMHCALSDKVGKLPSGNAAFDWMAIWAAEVLTGAHIGADGMTSYRRLRRWAWSPQVASFGEQVLARRARALAQGGLEPGWDLSTYRTLQPAGTPPSTSPRAPTALSTRRGPCAACLKGRDGPLSGS